MEKKNNSPVELDPSIERLFENIEHEGGVQKVSKKIEKSSVSMYNYRNNGVAPNWNYVLLLANTFKDWDLNKLFRGVPLEDDEIRRMKEENERLKNELQNERQEKDMFKRFAMKANFKEGDINRLLADDILMMITYPAKFNEGFNVARPNEIN